MAPLLHWRYERYRPSEGELDAFDLPAQLKVVDAWLEVDLAPHWRVAYRLVPVHGVPVVAEVRVFPADNYFGRPAGDWRARALGVRASDPKAIRRKADAPVDPPVYLPAIRHGITARLLKTVKIGGHRRLTSQFYQTMQRIAPGYMARHGFVKAPQMSSKGPRKDARPDVEYARLARDYVARIEAGCQRPIADVAKRHGLRITIVRDRIHTARERGLLTPTGAQGLLGGALTPLALSLLSTSRGPK